MADLTEIERCIQTIHARGTYRLSDAERTLLAKAPATHVPSLKLRMIDRHEAGDPQAALPLAEAAYQLDATAENLGNYIGCLRRCKHFGAAITLLSDKTSVLDPEKRDVWLVETLCAAGRLDEARAFGAEVLTRLDTRAGPDQPPAGAPRQGKSVIAFSLWGNNMRYLDGALRNTLVARYLYPGWTPRFYVDDSVPASVCKTLQSMGAQIISMGPEKPASTWGLFWRFLAADDPQVGTVLMRDADSVINWRERAAVADWQAGPAAVHVMRDWPTHCQLMLAGMWGTRTGTLPKLEPLIRDYLAATAHVRNNRARDQHFLAEVLWPYVRPQVREHDTCFGRGTPFPAGTELPFPMHVGQNDAVNQRPTAPDSPASAPAPQET